MTCVNCGKNFTPKLKEAACSDLCLDEAMEFDHLKTKVSWDAALQHWVYCAELRGEVVDGR